MTKAIEMLKEMAIQAVTADKVIAEGRKQILSVGRELFKRIPNLTEATTKWLDQYQKGRFEVTLDTSQLSKEVDKLSGLGNKWSPRSSWPASWSDRPSPSSEWHRFRPRETCNT